MFFFLKKSGLSKLNDLQRKKKRKAQLSLFLMLIHSIAMPLKPEAFQMVLGLVCLLVWLSELCLHHFTPTLEIFL